MSIRNALRDPRWPRFVISSVLMACLAVAWHFNGNRLGLPAAAAALVSPAVLLIPRRMLGLSWRRALAAAGPLAMGLVFLIWPDLTGPRWSRLAWMPAIGYLLLGIFIFFNQYWNRREQKEAEPLLSLVMLLDQPRYLDSQILARLASRAWGIAVEDANAEIPDGGDAGEALAMPGSEFATEPTAAGDRDVEQMSFLDNGRPWVMGAAPYFVLRSRDSLFALQMGERPYFDDLEAVLPQIAELRLRRAVQGHAAWLSLDFLAEVAGEGEGSADSSAGRQAVLQQLGQLMAELADVDCLAVFWPSDGALFLYDTSMETLLRDENPLCVLKNGPQPPVLIFEHDDPRMQAAMAEARQRWPEFVAAFEQRAEYEELDDAPAGPPRGGDGPVRRSHFCIKAPISDGQHTEYMWLEVTGLEHGYVYGRLQNEPVDLARPKLGDTLRVAERDVCDWMYMEGRDPRGAFTARLA